MALALSRLGQPAEAERLLRRALAIRTTVLAADHPDTRATRKNLSAVQARSGSQEPDLGP